MKVADLYGLLGLRVDRGSFAQGRNALGQFTAGAKKEIGGLRSVFRGLGRSIATLGLALGAANEGRRAFGFSEQLTSIAIASRHTIGDVGEFGDRVLEVSDDTSILKEQLLDGARAFISVTGDGATAAKSLGVFGRVAFATGGDMKELARVAAAMAQNMGLTSDEFERGFSILIKSGKLGAVELKDMASLLPSLTAQFSLFGGGKGTGGLAAMASGLQLIRQGFGTASEAATGFAGLMRGLQRHAKKFSDEGVQVYEKDGKTLRNFYDIVRDIKKKGFSGTKLLELVGRGEGALALRQLLKLDEAQIKMQKDISKGNAVQDDFNERMKSGTAKLRKFWNSLRNDIHRLFAVFVDWAGKATNHLGKIGIAVGALAVAFGLLKARAVASAIASTVAWVGALLPIALLAAGLMALIVLYESATGRDFFADVKKGIDVVIGKLKEAWRWVKKVYKGMGMAPARGGTTQTQAGSAGRDRSGRRIVDPLTREATRNVSRFLNKAGTTGEEGPSFRQKLITYPGEATTSFGLSPKSIHLMTNQMIEQEKQRLLKAHPDKYDINVNIEGNADKEFLNKFGGILDIKLRDVGK